VAGNAGFSRFSVSAEPHSTVDEDSISCDNESSLRWHTATLMRATSGSSQAEFRGGRDVEWMRLPVIEVDQRLSEEEPAERVARLFAYDP
jgi:hypothetical protein